MNAGQRWHENPSGHVVIEEADPGLATREMFTTAVTRVSQPVDAYVITTLNRKGFGTREFIDPLSHYLVRRENRTPNGTVVTTYDGFAAFGERHLAAHWHIHDETTATDTDFFVRDYAAGTVTDSDVAIPAIKRAIVEYPAGVDRVILPSVFERSGHVLVRLTINGRGLDFVLDTGAGSIVLDAGVASQLGLNVFAKQISSANAGRAGTGAAIVPLMSVGSLQLRDTVVSIAPWAEDESDASPSACWVLISCANPGSRSTTNIRLLPRNVTEPTRRRRIRERSRWP